MLAVLALLVAACGSDSDDDAGGGTGGGGGGSGDCEPVASPDDADDAEASGDAAASVEGLTLASTSSKAAAARTTQGGAGGSVHFCWIPWDEDIAATYLWKVLLEEQGYEVEMTQADVAPLFDSLAGGEFDVFLDGWLPTTHADYWEQYQDDLTQVGVWYDQAVLTIAVPEYVDVDSLTELADRADDFDNRIVGIEPGSGLMRVTEEAVIPTYCLEEFTLLEGSTPSMLTELRAAIDNEENIVVTLWRPHWIYSQLDLKDLEDPEGTLGEAEEIHVLANSEWAEANPEVIGWLERFELTDEQLGTLEDLVLNEHEGDEEAGAKAWLEDPANRAIADAWFE